MTRSVEIPDAEQERVTSILHEFEHGRLNSVCPGVDDCQLWYDAEIRTAYLLPALPYLAPAEPAEVSKHKQSCEWPDCPGNEDCEGISRPAGDGGLREALGQAWDDGNAAGLDGYVGPGRGAGEVDPEAVRARERILDKLAAHPAAPAVPQPADRQVSKLVLADTIQAMMCGTVDRARSVERSDSESTAEVIIDSLVAAGLLVAVPQPVDREALMLVLTKWDVGGWKYEDAEGCRERVCNSLLAVLAGEQEQARG